MYSFILNDTILLHESLQSLHQMSNLINEKNNQYENFRLCRPSNEINWNISKLKIINYFTGFYYYEITD